MMTKPVTIEMERCNYEMPIPSEQGLILGKYNHHKQLPNYKTLIQWKKMPMNNSNLVCNFRNRSTRPHTCTCQLLTYSALDDYWVARLGALRMGSSFPSPYEQLRPVSHIILHPGYVDAGFLNDISLLRLREPVQFSDFVRPVCLPPAPIRDGRLCTVVGWGQLFEIGRIFRKSPEK